MASPSGTGGEYPPELVHGELCATRFSLKAVCDCGKEPEPGPASVSPAEPPEGETLDALRWSLLKAMGDWSEGTYAAGWMSGTEEMLHEQGGIWEILGRAVGWPTGYEHGPDFRWVSWDEAGAIFAERKAARGY